MKNTKINAKEKIYQATVELLRTVDDVNEISSRQITAKAGVNLALINYYYQSKENLLSEIVGKMMEDIIQEFISKDSVSIDSESTDIVMGDAESKLRGMLIATADAAFQHEKICKIAVRIELNRGCSNSCLMIRSYLQDICPDCNTKTLEIVAMQLMFPFHHIVLEPKLYSELLDTDFYDKQRRDLKINEMISCALAALTNVNT